MDDELMGTKLDLLADEFQTFSIKYRSQLLNLSIEKYKSLGRNCMGLVFPNFTEALEFLESNQPKLYTGRHKIEKIYFYTHEYIKKHFPENCGLIESIENYNVNKEFVAIIGIANIKGTYYKYIKEIY